MYYRPLHLVTMVSALIRFHLKWDGTFLAFDLEVSEKKTISVHFVPVTMIVWVEDVNGGLFSLLVQPIKTDYLAIVR